MVTGKDRVSWLNGLVTCDLVKWPAGEARYGLVVSRSGRVLADPILVAESDRALVVVAADRVEVLREHLDHYLVMEDAEMAPADRCLRAVGAARAPLRRLCSPRRARPGRPAESLDRTGLGGAIVLAPADHAAEARAAVDAAALAAGGVVGDDEGWEALRLERGVPRFGVDFDDKTYPQEASLEKAAVSFDKGCYLGQEVVCMLEMRGHVKRKLVSIVLEGDSAAEQRRRGGRRDGGCGRRGDERRARRRRSACPSRWRWSSARRRVPGARRGGGRRLAKVVERPA